MKEIKFRAWDDINKKMHANDTLNILVKNISNKQYGKQQWYYMQFTGITLLNDTEVYEKDIIKISSGYYVILYDNNNACFCYSKILMHPISKMKDEDYLNMTVEGNIYTHKHLLEK